MAAAIPIAVGIAVGAIAGGITGGRKGAMLGAAGGAIAGAAAPAIGGLAGGIGGEAGALGAEALTGQALASGALGIEGAGVGAAAGGAGGALSGIGSVLSGAAPYISTAGSLASAFMGTPSTDVPDYSSYYSYTPPESKVIAPELTGMEIKYATTGERTPEEIDAANRLRIQREQSYAAQKARAESDLLKALSSRDISSGLSPETAMSEQRTAAQKFVGLPPTLGQARHSWA